MQTRHASRLGQNWRRRHVAPASDCGPVASTSYEPLQTTTEAAELVCFLASHISSDSRAEQLGWMLASAAAQQGGPPVLHMSWSASSAVQHAVRHELARVPPNLQAAMVVTEQPARRRSQFEHLRALVQQADAGAAPEWVYFTDDDDLWSPHRGALFLGACRQASPTTRAVVCTRKTRPARPSAPILVPDVAGVRNLLASGDARYTSLDDFDVTVESFNMDEYFDYAVRRLAHARPRVCAHVWVHVWMRRVCVRTCGCTCGCAHVGSRAWVRAPVAHARQSAGRAGQLGTGVGRTGRRR